MSEITASLVRSSGGFTSIAVDPVTGIIYERLGYSFEQGTNGTVLVYDHYAAFASGTPSSTITLQGDIAGTYISAYNGSLYGRVEAGATDGNGWPAGTQVAEWDATTGLLTEPLTTLSGIGGTNWNDSFDWGGFSAVNWLEDANGRYVFGQVPGTDNWRLMKVDDQLQVEWTIDLNIGTALGYAFIIDGILYLGEDYNSTHISRAFDIATQTLIDVDFDLGGMGSVYISAAEYDPASDTLYLVDTDGSSIYRITGAADAFAVVNVIDGTEGDDRGDTALIGTSDADLINGYGGNDELIGLGGDDTLNGGDGHDYLRGGAGNDELNGGDGDDYLSGGAGDDAINGGAGYDRAAFSVGATGGVTVDLNQQGSAQDTGQGMDTLTGIENVSGTRYSDTITGDGGDNWLWGGSDGSGVTGDDTISGGDGNDLVEVGTGNHTLDGGGDNDTLSLSGNGTDITPDGVTVSLALQGGAQDTEQGSMTLTGFENLSGSHYDDNLTGDGNDNLLAGEAGADTLVGGEGNDTLYGDGSVTTDSHGLGLSGPIVTVADTGAASDDTLEGGLGNDYIDGGLGTDTASYENALGGVGVWLGGGYSWGADGDDTLVNIENVIGSDHADEIYGDDNANSLDGGAGNDAVLGEGGDDTLFGGDGHDGVRGGAGDDSLYGGAGDDLLYGNAGDDYIDGGDGYDRVGYYSGATAGVTVDLNLQGTAQDTGQGWDTLVGIENVSGTVFDDILIGDGNDNVLWGSGATISPGNIASTNNDTLIGGGGNDLLIVGIGNHVVDGGDGIDTFSFTENGMPETGITLSLLLQGSAQASGNGSWTLTGIENLSGSVAGDNLIGDANANVLAGSAGDDSLSGGDGNDTLYGDGDINWDTHGVGGSGPIVTTADTGAAGNDTLEGGLGDDHIDGGLGTDTASYANALGGVTVELWAGYASGADGNDTLVNVENVVGSDYDDALVGDGNANELSGAAGNDYLDGLGGDDILTGGDGQDIVLGSGGDDTVSGGDGHDSVRGGAGNDSIYGDGGDDLLYGNAGDDYIDGGDGYDRVGYYSGATAGVTVDLNLQGTAQDTGQGWDTLVNIENVSGTVFGDTLIGDGNDNVLWGSASTISPGNVASTNNDTLSGGGGNDLLIAGIGNHVIDGGSDNDTFAFSENGAPETGITLSLLLQGSAQDSGNGSWTLTGIENLSGSIAGDDLTGDGNANVLAGDAGDDLLSGGDGNDTLYGDGAITWDTHELGGSGPIVTIADTGAAGNDTLEGGLGDDHIDGGAGIDTASYANALGGVEIYLWAGEVYGADGSDTLVNIENVIGSDYDDFLAGSGLDNILSGGGGADFIQGRGGNDMVYGDAGDDLVRGDAGDDQIFGGDGNDNLRGGSGVDYFDGGSNTGDYTLNAGWGDRVSFYEVGATQGVVADLRTGIISNDGFGNVETMVGIESLGADTAFVDTFYGNDERNLLMANLGDYLYGFGGDDDFLTTSAAALVDGGDGTDTLALGSYGGWLMADADADGFAETAAATTNGWVVNLTTGYVEDGYGNTGAVTGIENVNGSENADIITGDANANVLNGLDGSDILDGGAGDDTLLGGAQNDTLIGGAGSDFMDGGDGESDSVSYWSSAGPVDLNLQAGYADEYDPTGTTIVSSDTLTSIEYAIGSNFGDALVGSDADNYLDGAGGDDLIFGGAGNDQIFGGAGNDNISGDFGLGAVTGGGDDNLDGGDGNDTVRGRDGNDIVLGGAGNDFVEGGTGDDLIDGGDGIDRAAFFSMATGGVHVDLNLQGVAQDTGQGMDTLLNIENVSGTPYADTLIGDNGDNWLWGSVGTLGDGTPTGTNNDTLDGGGGNDLLMVGDGNHSLTGGTGIDTVAFTQNGAPETGLTLSLLLQGSTQVTGNGSWTLNGIENLSGSIAGDSLTGDANDNVLAGDTGDDNLAGGDGNDTLYGDGRIAIDYAGGPGNSGPITTWADVTALDPSLVAGNDTLEGGLGDDYIDGGAGVDTASYANALGGVEVYLGAGQSYGADGNDTLVNIENVIGSDYDDFLAGSGLDNLISGGGGADFIQGRGGNDTVYGDAGDDLVRGDAGDDQLFGGDGNDNLRGGAGIDSFDGGSNSGDYTLNAGWGDRVSFYEVNATQGVVADLRTGIISNDGFGNVETMTGIESLGADTAFVDTLYGNDERNLLLAGRGDYLYGFGGDDNFLTTAAAAMVDGGDGIDTLALGSYGGWLTPDSNGDGLAEAAAATTGGWVVNLTTGYVEDGYGNTGSVVGIENVDGSENGDAITGDANANVLNGVYGDDLLEGAGGDDTLDGGDGVDTASYVNALGGIFVDLGAGYASGADGTDTLVNVENVIGSDYADELYGDHNANSILAGDGNDVLWGFGGDDTLDGGAGHDYVRGGAGNDAVVGGSGDDFLYGNAGDDLIDGGDGYDRAGFSAGATAGVTVDLNLQGTAQDTGQGWDTLVGIEHVSGTIFDDVIIGDGGDNWLWGGWDGSGGSGNDTISAGDGNDLVSIGTGNHSVDGSSGIDTLSFYGLSAATASAGVTFSLALQGASQDSEQGMTVATGFENLAGWSYDDNLTGDGGDNVIAGHGGNDTLAGGDGNDTLYGDGSIQEDSHGTGLSGPIVTVEDTGAAGNDVLVGGRGNDSLYGGAGNDVLTGGQGQDLFVFGADSGDDVITDFGGGQDTILFEAESGVTDFSQLTFTKSGNNVIVTWGTDDSIVLQGVKPKDISAASFQFEGSSIAAMALPEFDKGLIVDSWSGPTDYLI